MFLFIYLRPERMKSVCSVSIYLLIALATAVLFSGCATPAKYDLDPKWQGYTETGQASYYAMKFQFRSTASGEKFNTFALTAAHRTLPFGSKVKVTNLSNGKSVVVRINDRGPFVRGRIIDLTRSAFARIENLKRGIIEVAIKVVP